ncbi:MAG: tetratricopeptide repeat protein [Planctomycetota bacterium]
MKEPAAQDASPWILDADVRSFEREVVARSRELPVVVDFWAEWCSPCKALGPILEKAAREGNGRFLLARVDVDKNPELAQVFRIQSIPTVIALAGGRLADGFTGALPPAEVAAFLDRVAPAAAPPAKDAAARARERAAEGDPAGAVELLRARLREAPGDASSRLALAELLLDAEKIEEAKLVLARLTPAETEGAEVKAVASRLALLASAGDLDELRTRAAANPADAAARASLGRALVARKDWRAGLTELLEAVRLDPEGAGGEARAAMLEAFAILGVDDPVANEFRFQLSLLLFS